VDAKAWRVHEAAHESATVRKEVAMADKAMRRALNIDDLRKAAHARLPRGVFDYLERGVEDELALDGNRAAFRRIKLLPRVLRGVETVDTTHQVLGETMAFPFAVAPTGGASLFSYKGDIAAARAAAKRNIPFIISTASTLDVEEIATAGGKLWFQLYLWENRELSHAAMARAAAVGCPICFVTVDLPVAPNREYNERNGFGTPFRIGRRNTIDLLTHPRWFAGVLGRYMLEGGIPQQANLPAHLRGRVTQSAPVGAAFKNDNLDWDEMKGLRDRWRGKFVIKGIMRPDDAERALALGADGIVVSNHGGRALDCAPATIDALPHVVAAVGGRMAVFVDGGVLRGTDIVKAIALGADAVLVGRALCYGLAAGGEAGAGRALDLLAGEVRRTMGLAGCRSVAEITRDLVAGI
jgi:isopentenyl diphosphate isomerase/L-lactate dehydrogenase-like FMN-dependent dehydrogenase